MRVLIFGTCYVDTPERLKLTRQWVQLHMRLNQDCEFLLVDSASPLLQSSFGVERAVEIWSFPDNIGHLSRNGPTGPTSKGRDGWGRAFCKGLEIAIDRGFDYAVHIEGDSLFRLPVLPITMQMRANDIKVASVPVAGTKRVEHNWVETGLMFFDVGFLRESNFIAGYDWPNREEHPTPEAVIHRMLGSSLVMMPWQAQRGDKSQIGHGNVAEFDWITHVGEAVYDRFLEAAVR